MPHRLTSETIEDEAQLRALLGEPTPIVRSKLSDRVNRLTRAFVERASMFFLATSGRDGSCDVSPRGDPAGFVRVLDDRTLLVPERPGNRLADSLRNILVNPRVGLLFIVPGVSDTFRVNGRATITSDRRLLEPCACEGKVPRLGLIVDVEEAFTHCSKAFLRSDFWNAARFVDRAELAGRAIRPSRRVLLRLSVREKQGRGVGQPEVKFRAAPERTGPGGLDDRGRLPSLRSPIRPARLAVPGPARPRRARGRGLDRAAPM